jgi:hypothetical protein
MFQSAQGMYLLDRGLNMQYIGSAVEDGFAAIKADGGLAGASLASGTSQVRFLGTDSVILGFRAPALAYDYFFKQWYEWNLPSNQIALAAMTSVAGVSCYADATGAIWVETPGGSESGLGVPWSFVLPHLAVGQIGGRFLAYELRVMGTYQGPHTIVVSNGLSYGEASDNGTITFASAPASYQVQRKLAKQQITALQVSVSISPNGAAEGARISALSLLYGAKPSSFALPGNRRMT